ncbi:hypothetical protein ACFQZ4_47720 [Catellatospora coxensis]
MPAAVRDLVPAFLDFWQQAANASAERRLALWRDYVARHPEVVHDVTRGGGEPDPTLALARYRELVDRIKANAPSPRPGSRRPPGWWLRCCKPRT